MGAIQDLLGARRVPTRLSSRGPQCQFDYLNVPILDQAAPTSTPLRTLALEKPLDAAASPHFLHCVLVTGVSASPPL